jgi:nucleoside-diphosphate-sugar epimerase
MRVAVAGSGDLSHYLFEELPKAGHGVVALVRSRKTFLDDIGVEQRVSDFTLQDLKPQIADCEALISVISGKGDAHVDVHLAMLEACKQSKYCKKFIPSEWTINVEDYPDHPMFSASANMIIRKALEAQKVVHWTIVINGWFMDYLIPEKQRHISSFPSGYFIDLKHRTFVVPDGLNSLISLTCARDVARATALLIKAPSLEPYTHIAGETMPILELFDKLKRWDPRWCQNRRTLAETVGQIVEKEKAGEPATFSYLDLLAFTGANSVRVDKAMEHKQKYYPDVHFRQVDDVLLEASLNPGSKI